MQEEWRDHFFLSTEDYLHSLISLVNELVSNSSRPLLVLPIPRKNKGGRFSSLGCDSELTKGVARLVQLPEQSRLAINRVTMGDYAAPVQYSKFAKELSNAFGLLNLKNDSLRKRFDSIKYDVKRLEEGV